MTARRNMLVHESFSFVLEFLMLGPSVFLSFISLGPSIKSKIEREERESVRPNHERPDLQADGLSFLGSNLFFCLTDHGLLCFSLSVRQPGSQKQKKEKLQANDLFSFSIFVCLVPDFSFLMVKPYQPWIH